MTIEQLMQKAHKASMEKGFWDDRSEVYKKDENLALAISELSEAIDADRKGRRSKRTLFPNAFIAGRSWNEAFEEYIKDTVEDELADAYLRLIDYAAGFGLRVRSIDESYHNELANIKHHKMIRFSQTIFFIIRDVTDVRFMPFPGRKIGEALAKIQFVCDQLDIDLHWHMEQKMKYNEGRPDKHGNKY